MTMYVCTIVYMQCEASSWYTTYILRSVSVSVTTLLEYM